MPISPIAIYIATQIRESVPPSISDANIQNANCIDTGTMPIGNLTNAPTIMSARKIAILTRRNVLDTAFEDALFKVLS